MKVSGLRQVALAHLQRFPCSKKHLLTVLSRKIKRSVKAYDDDEAELMTAAAEVIASLDGGAFLDDTRYALGVMTSLNRRGKSRRAIRQKLMLKGLEQGDIKIAMEALAGTAENPDLLAAIRYAQRRRLGPFQRDETRRQERKQKDLAALARQGFSYDIAKTVINAETPDELEPQWT